MPDKNISSICVKDAMVKKVISVEENTPLIKAAKLIMSHNFDGVPVVDGNNKLVGILTEYDLIEKSSSIHLPNFQKEVKEVTALKVKDVMNSDPLTLRPEDSFDTMLNAFREHHRVNPIPVIDKNKKVVGVVSRFDVLKPIKN